MKGHPVGSQVNVMTTGSPSASVTLAVYTTEPIALDALNVAEAKISNTE